ncbi:energy transducer TonB [Chitinophaga sancti]|uniref:Energy transducer TonB n=1 Tax=Chitinophaga sancti TaxID=1004 RepID=A0A1K1Q5U4_9BACT|nr:energy transducer TonB [Chitinophaga sancti]WQD61156.1 energy transducer TonB [Chitinophaga sancti]WQG86717.1 energy transducer TonB [Chitinophaga sancti]SFW55288.1 outer membrane transport energization protein TonB [Chitinophaga sancti]
MNTTNIYNADFLDILFEGRNKEYGAYELRRSEDRRVRRALIGTVSIALVIVGGYVLSDKLFAASMHIRNEPMVKETILTNLHTPDDKVIPPPPAPPTPPPPAVSSVKITPPIITRDDLVRAEDEVVRLDSIGNKSVGVANIQGDDINGRDIPSLLGGDGPGNNVVEAPVVERETILCFVEMMPTFPGGEDALLKFLRDNVKYPHVAQENEIQGTVFVQFVVDKEGNINDVKTIGATKGGGLEEESIRVVKKMPKWKPGKQNNQKVSVQYNLPIRYTLQN